MTIKHNLDGILDPETLKSFLPYLHEIAKLPFIQIENYGGKDEKIIFWKPKDTSVEGDVCIPANYVIAFLEYCGRGDERYSIFPLIVAEMVKNGRLGEMEDFFLTDIARYAFMGYAVEHFASWVVKGQGPLPNPDFSWINIAKKV